MCTFPYAKEIKLGSISSDKKERVTEKDHVDLTGGRGLVSSDDILGQTFISKNDSKGKGGNEGGGGGFIRKSVEPVLADQNY